LIPPLIISEEQLNEGISIIDEALSITDNAVE
jgi:4-aminobutyrate aminotransferase-like enzyme